jgi:rubrerythrin
MAHWSLDDIPWHSFDSSKTQPDLVALVKAASMVEYNGQDYARYLNEVFADDKEFHQVAEQWAQEEVQHGMALRKWAELADPSFDFDRCFKDFTTGYSLPQNVKASVRGSRTGELIARCVVETGTSSYYTAIAESTEEPVLKAVCLKIAADELRHYKLFYTYLKQYLVKENIGRVKRFSVALGRITESEDDELSYAFFAAHNDGQAVYNRETYGSRYMACAMALYRPRHIERMVSMVFKAVGVKPPDMIGRAVSGIAWRLLQRRARKLDRFRQEVISGAAYLSADRQAA